MSISSMHAQKFYEDVAHNLKVFTIKDNSGYPAPKTPDGKRAQPFWSSKSRAEKIIENVPAYKMFTVVEISWNEFKEEWVPDLTKEKLLVGINWSGKGAKGYDLEPKNVEYWQSKE